jgi:hypothetical protein
LQLVGDFDVWVEYDWAHYDGSGDSRAQLWLWNMESTEPEELVLNCHRWQSGTAREIIFHHRREGSSDFKCWVSSYQVPLSGKLRIKRVGTTCYGYYWESDGWTEICSVEAFGTAAFASLVGNNRSNNYPNGAFEVHWDNFHAEAYEIIGPEAPPVADAGGPYLGAVGTDILFDGTGSSDPDSDPLTYAWDFGDSGTGTGATPTYSYAATGIYDVCLTVNDGTVDSDPACTIAVIYDPSAGFVTGGGWIYSEPGYYASDETLEGKATFGFVSKYKKGATLPTGNTEFQFKAGDLNFHSSSYEWLVVTGSDYARFKGTGTINGSGEYKFMLWAGDSTPDTFRIRIWLEDEVTGAETDVYDNGFDQTIGGGSIVIHTK